MIRLRSLRLSVVPRSRHLTISASRVLEMVLPQDTSHIENLEVILRLPGINGSAAQHLFASFRDLDFAAVEILSLNVSISTIQEMNSKQNLHVWALSSTSNRRRRRSIALPEEGSRSVASEFWSAIVLAAAPTIRDLWVPVSILPQLLLASDACVSTIESLEIRCIAGILKDYSIDVPSNNRPLELPGHLLPELNLMNLPHLPRLKRPVLQSILTGSHSI